MEGSCSQTPSMNEATFSAENPTFASAGYLSIIQLSSLQSSCIASASHSRGKISGPNFTDGERSSLAKDGRSAPRQHFLYFLPLPQGQGSFRPARHFRAGRWYVLRS